jgi:hypothetical protein
MIYDLKWVPVFVFDYAEVCAALRAEIDYKWLKRAAECVILDPRQKTKGAYPEDKKVTKRINLLNFIKKTYEKVSDLNEK